MKPSEVVSAVTHCLAARRPTFIWGPVGVGKSDVMRYIARTTGRELRDVRLSLLDPVDLKGFPVPDMASRLMTWLPADFLPQPTIAKEIKKGRTTVTETVPNDTRGVIFFDEANSALPATQAAMYQLALDRCIGNYRLPDGWDIVMAGNRESDRSVVHRMPAALRNRLIHIDFEVDQAEWSQWAIDNNVRPEIIAFLRFRGELLHSYDSKVDPVAFPTPRSWAFVNDLMDVGGNVGLELLKGTVGERAGSEFTAFLQIFRELPNIDEILVDPESVEVPAKLGALYAVSTELALRSSRDNMDRLMLYVNRLPPEFQVVFVRDAIRRDREVQRAPSYTKWAIRNSDMLT